jgi:hypothetical protein
MIVPGEVQSFGSTAVVLDADKVPHPHRKNKKRKGTSRFTELSMTRLFSTPKKTGTFHKYTRKDKLML